jgi:hypothetical protein
MATFNRFDIFNLNLAHKVHDLGSDQLKVYLSNTAPDASTDTVKADIPEISAGGGYTAGGNIAAVASSAQVAGTYRLILQDPVTWIGTGAGFGPFRYAVMYNSTAANSPLIGYWDYGYEITLVGVDETFRVDFDQSIGIIVLQ